MGMEWHWNRVPRDVVDVLSLAVFKTRLDEALSNLVWWKVSLPMAGGLELDGFQDPLPTQNSLGFWNSGELFLTFNL